MLDGTERSVPLDPGEGVALVARSRRELLLRAHGHKLAWAELEDCYSQATLELLRRVAKGAAFSSRAHVANALEQRFLSRISDRRRALNGRSPIEAAISSAIQLEDCAVEVVDRGADVERIALTRHELRRIGALTRQLSPDQRLLLGSQLSCDMARGEFCRMHGWSEEKYRKVGQRARARLTKLLSESAALSDSPVPLTGRASE